MTESSPTPVRPGHIHDPSIIKQGNYYYLFSTGQGIPIHRSTDLVNWERFGRIFEDGGPAWAREAVPGTTGYWWAPDISYSGGLYRVYYSVSTFGSQRSLIALAVNKTLDPNSPDYKWEDRGIVIESAPGKTYFNAIDADAFTDNDGRQWLIFGSFFGGIKMGRLDSATNKLADPNLIHIASRSGENAIEAPCLMYRQGFYYLFVSFDFCCRGLESTYKVMVGRSENVMGPYFDREGRDMREGGGTLLLQSDDEWIGPGHNDVFRDGGTDYIVHHAYDPRNNGRPTLLIR
ncbi:MAG TPA: arabinan endo-1,5-alpha-L-arabinosidase, partial [Sedimentisphaerales bacterium]|nr:arabinan endo-1,5-alpha-L-arabinosidase [Sedimentisphaerales bacterium]